jgi:hypothetical protein
MREQSHGGTAQPDRNDGAFGRQSECQCVTLRYQRLWPIDQGLRDNVRPL